MQRTMESIISKIASNIPLFVLRKLTATKLILPYYHMVSDEDIVHIKHLYEYKTVRSFREDMDFLLKNYVPTDLFEVLDCIKTGRRLSAPSFLLTFDDGFREMYDTVAPILLEKGICATFFVNSAFLDNKELCYLNKASLLTEQLRRRRTSALEQELSRFLRTNDIPPHDTASGILSVRYEQRNLLDDIAAIMNVDFGEYLANTKPYLTSGQIRELLGKGFAVGAHSIDHPFYATLTLEDQLRQTMESVRYVKETFLLDYGVFAFPHSDNHVSGDFFSRLSASGSVDLSFGTAGLIDDCVPTNLQRFSMEKPIDAAGRIVAFQHTRKLFKRVTGSAAISRN